MKSREKRFIQCDHTWKNKEARWSTPTKFTSAVQTWDRSLNREQQVHTTQQSWSRYGPAHLWASVSWWQVGRKAPLLTPGASLSFCHCAPGWVPFSWYLLSQKGLFLEWPYSCQDSNRAVDFSDKIMTKAKVVPVLSTKKNYCSCDKIIKLMAGASVQTVSTGRL